MFPISLLWAVCAAATPFMQALPAEAVSSSFNCTETENLIDRQCFFRDAYVVDKVVWLVSIAPMNVPQVLCTSVDLAAPVKCSIEWHTPTELATRLSSTRAQMEVYETGIVFSRLNPYNPYHTLFEEYLPIFELIASTPQLAHWLEPPRLASSQLLVIQDDPNRFESKPDYSIIFPNARRMEKAVAGVVFRVKLLVAGTRASCVHAGYCSRGRFSTPDVGAHFRRHALQRLTLPVESHPATKPRVTFVQRSMTRMVANLEELLATVNGVLTAHHPATAKAEATVVDFGRMSVKDQAATAANTDILILVHGGAIGNAVFLPHRAVVVDIYPYAFPSELHGYIVNGIRLTMPSMRYGHWRVETNDSSTVVLMNRRCLTPHCTAVRTTPPFHITRCIYVDVKAFATHFIKVLLAWCHAIWSSNPRAQAACAGSSAAAQEVYAPPPSTAEFNKRAKEYAEHFNNGDAVSCDQHIKCDAAIRRRFRPYRQCKVY